MATNSARLKNQYKIKYQTALSAKFDEQKGDNQLFEETELFIKTKYKS